MNPLPYKGAKVVSFALGYAWIDEDDLCRIRLSPGANTKMGIPEVRELADAVYNLCEGNKHKHLIDSRDSYGPVLPGAREEVRYNEKILACRSAAAMIVNNMANKMIIAFFIQFNKPPYPYRVYEDPEEAARWLKSL